MTESEVWNKVPRPLTTTATQTSATMLKLKTPVSSRGRGGARGRGRGRAPGRPRGGKRLRQTPIQPQRPEKVLMLIGSSVPSTSQPPATGRGSAPPGLGPRTSADNVEVDWFADYAS